MSARDFFVVDEEHEACAREAYVSCTAERGNHPAEPHVPEGKSLANAGQFGKKNTFLRLMLRRILPVVVAGLALTFLAAAGHNVDNTGGEIPSPCRG